MNHGVIEKPATQAAPLRDDPTYRDAAERFAKIDAECWRIEQEIISLDAAARAIGRVAGPSALADATRALTGDTDGTQESERRSQLATRLALMKRALPEALDAMRRAENDASAAYMRSQAGRVASALEQLASALDRVLAASALFDAVRRDASALGYDTDRGGVPIGADLRHRDYAEHWAPQVRSTLAELRNFIGQAG